MLFDSFGDYVFFDGAMGTMLQSLLKGGLKPGANPAVLSVSDPRTVESIHRMYAEAGSGAVCANTFGAKIVGGCCGTTPEHIRELRKAFSNNRKIPGEVRRR